ncbi:MAG: hypothetical protein LAT83_00555 [Kiritimatiellae bacterium]|nr:hypothetical protein [Kiritimatiellia bacterium]
MNLPLRPATAETNGSTMRGIDRAQGSLSTGDKDDNGLGNLGENHYASDNDVRIDVEEVPYAANPLWPDHPDIGLTAGGRLVQ